MRTLMTMLIACVATIGIASASTQDPLPATVAPSVETSAPTDDGVADDTEDTGYECKYSPYCRKASQCEAYCAGGEPACVRGCCACAS